MNARQFVNSTVCAVLERSPAIGKAIYTIPLIFFPEFVKSVNFRNISNPLQLGIVIYFIVFILVFFVQAALAYLNGVLFGLASFSWTLMRSPLSLKINMAFI